MALVSLAGINGERGAALTRYLGGYEPMTAYDLLWTLRDHGSEEERDLFRVQGAVETAQAVLRALEARGNVKRRREGREDIWEVRDA